MQQPPNPYPYFPPSQTPIKQPHQYRGWILTALVLCYLASLTFLFTEIIAMGSVPASTESSTSSSGILAVLATILMILLYGFIFVLDGRNVLSLFGRIHWKRLNGWQKAGLVFLYLCVFIIPGLYLLFAVQYFLRVRQQTLGVAIRGAWYSYKAKSPSTRIGIALITSLLLLSFVGLTSVFAMIDRENAIVAATITSTPTPTPTLGTTANSQSVATPTAIPTQPPTPTDTPTQPPTPTPTPKPVVVPTQVPLPTQPPVQPTPTTQGCYPLTNGGNCYEPGEYCRNSDHGATGIAGDGERIVCTDNDGWRWEPY